MLALMYAKLGLICSTSGIRKKHSIDQKIKMLRVWLTTAYTFRTVLNKLDETKS